MPTVFTVRTASACRAYCVRVSVFVCAHVGGRGVGALVWVPPGLCASLED